MTQQVINIGTGPSSGDGDPLRVAFTEINHNFTELYANVANLRSSVTSVAGRTGNVVLTINDIVGYTPGGVGPDNRYVSTVNSTNVGAVNVSVSSGTVFLAPLASGSASYVIGNGVSDGQTIRFLPNWKAGTSFTDVQNIWVFSDRFYNASTGTNGRYTTGYVPWYPFIYIQTAPQQGVATLTWDAQGQYWIPSPLNYD